MSPVMPDGLPEDGRLGPLSLPLGKLSFFMFRFSMGGLWPWLGPLTAIRAVARVWQQR
jgi:hypothetical protein